MNHRLRNYFGHPMERLMWAMWNLISVWLETVLVKVKDRCLVCAKRTIGSKINLGAPDGTPR
jgi:hypothetical protein